MFTTLHGVTSQKTSIFVIWAEEPEIAAECSAVAHFMTALFGLVLRIRLCNKHFNIYLIVDMSKTIIVQQNTHLTG
jgi:hypothetical protein